MDFEIVGELSSIEPMAVGRGVRVRSRLNRVYGKGRRRKLRGFASVRQMVQFIEVHWYEAHGIGRRDMKLKLPLLD